MMILTTLNWLQSNMHVRVSASLKEFNQPEAKSIKFQRQDHKLPKPRKHWSGKYSTHCEYATVRGVEIGLSKKK